MSAVIYTKPACPYCDHAKTLLTVKNVPYTETIIGEDIIREEFIELFPDVKTVPLIFVDGKRIGGYSDLREYFNNGTSDKQFLTEQN